MQFKVLGPLEVQGDKGAVELRGPKPRAVLAVLLLHANQPVSSERLAMAVWGEDSGTDAREKVQVTVSRLRKALGDPTILVTQPAGYELRVRSGELDAELFEQYVHEGRRELAAGQAEQAGDILRRALSLWRGAPLAELTFESFAQADIARLEEQRLAALEVRVDADLASGRHAELVGELRQLVAGHPTREKLAGQLMLALYRCGRQAEALDAYREARDRLVEEIGVEPGPELRRLHEAILQQDDSLQPEPTPEPELPVELDAAAAPPLVGRGAELAWLEKRWEQARHGAGTLVTLTGQRGIGKTRLSAELAGEAHKSGARVLYASAAGTPEAALDAVDRIPSAHRPTLLVIEDADQGPADLTADLGERDTELSRVPVLVLVTAGHPEALAPLNADASLELGPLDADAVRAIVSQYSRGQAAEEVPIDWLQDEARGVPRQVHELASQWARREASRLVGSVAGRAAAGRAELRSMEAELAGGVVELQAAEERDTQAGDDGAPVICPFKGLASFEPADAPYFFGREQLVAELVARLVGAPLLAVTGPSGSGKSSVVRAGLLPALAGGVLPGSEEWTQVLMRPGQHPSQELKRAMAGIESDRKTLVAVDQFEEVFTACRDQEERAAFLADLVRIARDPEARGLVVLAIRADYYGRCATYPELSRLLAANHVLVGPMRRDELRRAVERPALRVGLRVEPELTDVLVADVENEPGALPLLSTALLELWQRRDGRRLRLIAYEQTGGVRGAVARLAEEAFARLDESHQKLARTLLLRLAEVEPEGGVERRRLPLSDLEAEAGEEVTKVIGQLADARLLTVSAGAVEFAHEAVLREWPRLRDWIEDDQDDLKIHRDLSAAEQEWLRLDRDEGALYRGARLAEAREWAARGDPGPTEAERDFLAASLGRESRERGARRRRLALAFGTLAVGLVAIGVVALVAVDGRQDAETQRNIAESRELALQSADSLDADPELSLRLALLAVEKAATEQAAAALRESTLAFRQLGVVQADSLDANTADFSPNGKEMVTGGSDGRARVWDVAAQRQRGRLAADHGALLTARYSPGGEEIALGFKDGAVVLTDSALASPRELLSPKGERVESLEFSAEGERIAVATGDGTVRVLTPNGPLTQSLSGHRGAVLGIDINADGTQVASAGEDGTVRLWSLPDGGNRVLFAGKKDQQDVAFSPDGRRILAVGDDRVIKLWNARTGAEEDRVDGEGRELLAADFSKDGTRFAAGGRDGVSRVWSVAGGPAVAVLRGQRSPVFDVGFGPTGDRVISAGDDGAVRIWDAGQTTTWVVPSLTHDIDFNRDGRFLASSSDDGITRVWNTGTGQLQARLPGPTGYNAGKFSPTAENIVTGAEEDPRVRIWPIGRREADVALELPGRRGVQAVNYDSTGRRIVYVDDSGSVVVRDLATRSDVRFGGTPSVVWGAEISPDGKQVVAVPDRDVLIWRADRPARPDRVLRGHRGPINALDFSPDGRIITAGADRTVRVWGPRGEPAVVMRGHTDEVTTVLFTVDGRQALSSSHDGTLRLWDPRRGTMLGVLSDVGELYDVAMSRDARVATLGKGEVVRVFQCEVCGSLDQVLALATARSPRQLTAAEREQFLRGAD
jgi:WD40 repeat protein/DNA-binding SARP family transcriptional activator